MLTFPLFLSALMCVCVGGGIWWHLIYISSSICERDKLHPANVMATTARNRWQSDWYFPLCRKALDSLPAWKASLQHISTAHRPSNPWTQTHTDRYTSHFSLIDVYPFYIIPYGSYTYTRVCPQSVHSLSTAVYDCITQHTWVELSTPPPSHTHCTTV